jgi:hypothetical protein
MYVDITRITITLCWAVLIAFWCLKLFGANWFEIIIENENFVSVAHFIQDTWLKYAFNLITILGANFLIFSAILQVFTLKGKHLTFWVVSSFTMWIVANFVPIDVLKMFYGYIIIIAYAIIVNKGWKRCYGLLAIALEILFTSLSIVTRNIKLFVMTDYFISFILSIDLYIMYGLYYLYSNLIKIMKEKDMAIIVGHGWLSKESAQIKGYNAWKRFWHNAGYVVSFKWARKTTK